METRVSTKGQVVLPAPVRRKLGIRSGDALEVSAEAGRIILKPRSRRSLSNQIVTDPETGLPVLWAGEEAPVLRGKEVAEILASFP